MIIAQFTTAQFTTVLHHTPLKTLASLVQNILKKGHTNYIVHTFIIDLHGSIYFNNINNSSKTTSTINLEKDLFTHGVTLSLSCGVATLQGFTSAFISEIFMFSAFGSTQLFTGLVVSLYRDSLQNLVIGALLLNSNSRLSLGTKVSGIQRLVSLNLGDFAVGSILDPIGNYINNSSRLFASFRWLIETPAPSIISRQSVFEPMLSGIISIDAMIPIGRGQRELIIGDRQTGKTSIGVDTIINQKFQQLFAIYLPIGQKAATILEVYISLIRRSTSCYLTVFAASASSSAVLQYLSAYNGSALSEYFMYVRELPVFIFFDDLSKHAQAFREISLLLRRPPGREAYPGEVSWRSLLPA